MNDTNRSMNVCCNCLSCLPHSPSTNDAKSQKKSKSKVVMANNILQGTRHAEFLAIAEMLQTYPKSAIKETDLYVTVEPCIMCTAALRQYGIRSVFFGTHNERFGGVGGVLTVHSE